MLCPSVLLLEALLLQMWFQSPVALLAAPVRMFEPPASNNVNSVLCLLLMIFIPIITYFIPLI